ncbi:hypothetical protein E1N52_09655 [Paraburkholderia guartelaensis]|uniref:Uncharacterized protein n=1 Tax=Paraburkholderia guartelaensis TaxID=2546446 RepID=A0A4R5LHF5_9BURK|nr:hypothetical protein [Paraburkholderia guartelaensis]TDG08730.1 hypothetical protein E1N52_09655 [Paraburkholderia guartelaensis]
MFLLERARWANGGSSNNGANKLRYANQFGVAPTHLERLFAIASRNSVATPDGRKGVPGLQGAAYCAFFIARSLRWADIGAADAPNGFALACESAVLRLLVQRATKTGEIP